MLEKEILCLFCQEECWFRKEAEDIASAVSKRRNIQDKNVPSLDSEFVSKEIEKLRAIARDKRNCPNVNQINPDYPGKNLL